LFQLLSKVTATSRSFYIKSSMR